MNYSFLNKRHLLMENPLALIIMKKESMDNAGV